MRIPALITLLLALGGCGGVGSKCKNDSGCGPILFCYGGICNARPGGTTSSAPGTGSGLGTGGGDAGAAFGKPQK